MTADEKRDQKGALLLEFHEAEDDLAHLVDKARTLASNLSVISQVMREVSSAQQISSEKIRYQREEVEHQPKYRASMDFEAAIALLQQLDEAKNRLKTLKERKAALGLR